MSVFQMGGRRGAAVPGRGGRRAAGRHGSQCAVLPAGGSPAEAGGMGRTGTVALWLPHWQLHQQIHLENRPVCYPGISQDIFFEMGYPRICMDK